MKLQNILQQLNIPFVTPGSHHHVRDGWFGVDCPYCSPGTHRYRMGISLSGTKSHCWSCGGKGTIGVFAELSQQPYHKVKTLLQGIISNDDVVDTKVSGKLILPKGLGPLEKSHRRYLERRGFDPDQLADTWGVEGIALAANLSWRIFIPIRLAGNPVSWTTRSLDPNAKSRYITAGKQEEKIHHKTILFGEDYAKHAVIVVEGPFDVFAIGQGAVATFGLSYTKEQVKRIARYPMRVIAFDNESKAKRKAFKLCRDLQTFPGETYRVILSGKDAASSPKRELMELRKRFLHG